MIRALPTTSSLAEAQGWRCCFCGFLMLSRPAARRERREVLASEHRTHRGVAAAMRTVTREHVTPRCEGGDDTRENLVASCHWCNEYRGNRPAMEAFRRVQRLVRRGTHPHQVWQDTGRFPRGARLRTIVRSSATQVFVEARP